MSEINFVPLYFYEPIKGTYLGEGTTTEDPDNPGTYQFVGCATLEKPPECDDAHVAIYKDGTWSIAEKLEIQTVQRQEIINNQNLRFLTGTDWKVTRHRDQISAETTTSLTDSEYKLLLEQRQQARDAIIH